MKLVAPNVTTAALTCLLSRMLVLSWIAFFLLRFTLVARGAETRRPSLLVRFLSDRLIVSEYWNSNHPNAPNLIKCLLIDQLLMNQEDPQIFQSIAEHLNNRFHYNKPCLFDCFFLIHACYLSFC